MQESWTRQNPSPKADSDPNAEVARPKRSRGILYLDEQRLTRDCISQELARHFPDLSIAPRATVQDLTSENYNAEDFVLVVLHVHAGRLDDDSTIAELSMLDQVLPDPPLVLLSDVETADNIVAAFRRGIRGYIPTTLAIQEAIEAIRFVCVGGTFVPSSILSHAGRTDVTEERPTTQREAAVPNNFSPRQREVLRRLWMGKANKAIAYELDMCESTVKVHIRHIMKKLNASNRTQVVVLTRPSFFEVGILGDESEGPCMANGVAPDAPFRIAASSHYRPTAVANGPLRSKD
jgi:DNA-binding NarL/FixJ family response regulator